MSWLNTPAYDIQRPTGHCAITGRPLEPGETYIATLVEVDQEPGQNDDADGRVWAGLRRVDVALEAWEQNHRPDRLFSHWRSTVPLPNQKKKVFVDDEVLMDLLMRLGGNDQGDRVPFRFVLALVLMRKKLLRYDRSQKQVNASGQEEEWWQMTPKGSDQTIGVLNPQIRDEQIQQVTEQLGQILDTELL